MIRIAIALIVSALAAPAAAEVYKVADNGFILRQVIDVPAPAEKAWATLVTPAKWWSKDNSFSGDPDNFSLDPRAGGCFCEVLRNEVSPNAAPRGSVEHMRVIYVEEPRALRMSGALGPLQSEGVTGTLTIFLRPHAGGTRILWEYAVGGYIRSDPKALATSVDLVLAEQVLRLGQQLGVNASANAGSAAPQRQAREAETPAKSDFEREMEAGLKEADSRAAPRVEPRLEERPKPRPETDQPVFIGR